MESPEKSECSLTDLISGGCVQFEELSKAKIEAYLQAKQEEGRSPRPSPVASREEGSGKSSSATSARDTKASSQVCASTS